MDRQAGQTEDLSVFKSVIVELRGEVTTLMKMPKRPKLKPIIRAGKQGHGPKNQTASRKMVVDLKGTGRNGLGQLQVLLAALGQLKRDNTIRFANFS